MLRWGQHISYIGDDDAADWELGGNPEPLGYYLDLRTSKRDVELSGPLAPILTPFLDALILQGRDERLLPQLRKQAAAARAPVFPKSQGRERRADSLSDRWRANVGVGSGISRTRIHTMLGNLGEHGVRAALALCAQRSPRTAKWYQASALARRHMLGSQEMIAELPDLSEEDFALLAELGETGDLAECLQACDARQSIGRRTAMALRQAPVWPRSDREASIGQRQHIRGSCHAFVVGLLQHLPLRQENAPLRYVGRCVDCPIQGSDSDAIDLQESFELHRDVVMVCRHNHRKAPLGKFSERSGVWSPIKPAQRDFFVGTLNEPADSLFRVFEENFEDERKNPRLDQTERRLMNEETKQLVRRQDLHGPAALMTHIRVARTCFRA